MKIIKIEIMLNLYSRIFTNIFIYITNRSNHFFFGKTPGFTYGVTPAPKKVLFWKNLLKSVSFLTANSICLGTNLLFLD